MAGCSEGRGRQFPMIKAVFLDLDDTLYAYRGSMAECEGQLFATAGERLGVSPNRCRLACRRAKADQYGSRPLDPAILDWRERIPSLISRLRKTPDPQYGEQLFGHLWDHFLSVIGRTPTQLRHSSHWDFRAGGPPSSPMEPGNSKPQRSADWAFRSLWIRRSTQKTSAPTNAIGRSLTAGCWSWASAPRNRSLSGIRATSTSKAVEGAACSRGG